MRADGETHYFEETGKPERLGPLRAGDTVEAYGRTANRGRDS